MIMDNMVEFVMLDTLNDIKKKKKKEKEYIRANPDADPNAPRKTPI